MRVLGSFNVGDRITANAGTVFYANVLPYAPDGLKMSSGTKAKGRLRVNNFVYTTGATAHDVKFLRPLNYATLSAAAASGQAVVNLTDDPGIYSTNYKYKLSNGVYPSQVADNGIAANDLCLLQLADGSWQRLVVSSVSTLAITMTGNLAGAALAGGLLYFFGINTDNDPATGEEQFTHEVPASQTPYKLQAESGVFNVLHQGDPALFYSPNGTNAGFLELISGVYED